MDEDPTGNPASGRAANRTDMHLTGAIPLPATLAALGGAELPSGPHLFPFALPTSNTYLAL